MKKYKATDKIDFSKLEQKSNFNEILAYCED